jgi:hypothetical protein
MSVRFGLLSSLRYVRLVSPLSALMSVIEVPLRWRSVYGVYYGGGPTKATGVHLQL